MITEILQLIDFILNHNPHLLIIFFTFSITMCVIIVRKASKHKAWTGNHVEKVTALIPAYQEDPLLFEDTIRSIRDQVDEVITVIDGPDPVLITTAKQYGCTILTQETRMGKRKALALGLEHVTTPITFLLDSDTQVDLDAIHEILKPFADPIVGSVTSHTHISNTSNKPSTRISTVNEASRHIVNSALNPRLVCSPGVGTAYRTSILKKAMPLILSPNDTGEIGDDRALTRAVLHLGYDTVYQPTANTWAQAPEAMTSLVKQQLRWRRSGYKYFFRDILEGNLRHDLYYALHCLWFYLSPILLSLVVIFDLLFYPLQLVDIPLILSPLMFVIGIFSITALRQFLYLKQVSLRWVPLYALFGSIIMFPLSFYALITVGKQRTWGTR